MSTDYLEAYQESHLENCMQCQARYQEADAKGLSFTVDVCKDYQRQLERDQANAELRYEAMLENECEERGL